MTIVKRAEEFATAAHGNQKYGAHPYTYHLKAVAEVCRRSNLPEIVQVGAWLHDVVEDTETHANTVCAVFGYEVATLVFSVTDGEGANRKERKANTYPKILSHPHGVFLKLADRIANLEACSTAKEQELFEMYCKEAKGFKERLYTPGIAENMWKYLDTLYSLEQE